MIRRTAIPADQLPANGARSSLRTAGRVQALFNLDGTLYAIDDKTLLLLPDVYVQEPAR